MNLNPRLGQKTREYHS